MTLYPYRELTITSKVQECCGWEFAAKLGEFDYSPSFIAVFAMRCCELELDHLICRLELVYWTSDHSLSVFVLHNFFLAVVVNSGGFGKQSHQMAVVKFVLKSKYIHQIHFYTVHSIILCIRSKASIRFSNPFEICSKISEFNYVYEN